MKYQHFTKEPFTIKLYKYSKLDILQCFAHELSHVIHWSEAHTILHKRTELKIYNKFLTLLNRQGYVSEESE